MLALIGWLALVREQSALLESLDDTLRSRSDLIAHDLAGGSNGLADVRLGLPEADEGFAQVLDARGRLIDGTPRFAAAPAVPAGVATGTTEHRLLDATYPVLGPSRVYLIRVTSGGTPEILVVGASENGTTEAVDSLRRVLLLLGPLGVVATTAVGWFLAGLALRPVERMRRRADTIFQGDLAGRLPVPSTGDELSRLAVTMNTMLDRAQTAVDRERRLVDHASHELRTPLSIARAEVDLALRRPHNRKELERSLRSVGEELRWVARMSDDLLVLARNTQGHLPLRRERLSLGRIVDQSCSAFADEAARRGVLLERDVADGAVDADADRLRQATCNLIENAIRHTPRGGQVRVAAAVADGHAEIAVQDSGPGFAESVLDRAFEPFVTLADGAEPAGTGIGLAIVRAVAESHGGTAVAENVAGSGARVTLRLPLEPMPPDAAAGAP